MDLVKYDRYREINIFMVEFFPYLSTILEFHENVIRLLESPTILYQFPLKNFDKMAAGKNKTRRKKRISKHILKSQEIVLDTEKNTTAMQQDGSLPKSIVSPSESKEKKTHEKHPKEVASYLSSWKHRNSGGAWKFNKNTQSWLIRYMYNSEKVSKGMFTLLLEYLAEIRSENLLERIHAEATKRARRYKEWEKTTKENETSDVLISSTTSTRADTNENVEDKDGNSGWIELNDHDKRKEYKRARKVLETIDNRGVESS